MTDEQYEEIVEQALVDAYGDEEQIGSFCSVLQEEVKFPFRAKLLGQKISITGLGNDNSRVLAKTKNGDGVSLVDLRDIEIIETDESMVWVEAYVKWRNDW